MKLVRVVAAGVRELFPGYFAVAMATGINSIAAHLLGWHGIGMALFYVNLLVYSVLWLLTLGRLCAYLPRLVADLTSHARGPGFLTIVAATAVLGSQFVILRNDLAAGVFFWLLALLTWLLLIYAFSAAVMVKTPKPDLKNGWNGSWLVLVVATQSLAILGALISPSGASMKSLILFVALAMYLLGCALYLLLTVLIFYRLAFITLTPQELAPDYWINMGAGAIITLAGATLILHTPDWPFLGGILPFLKGFTLIFWVVATWWIPLLVILGFWRHDLQRYPIRYGPRYWDIVFPLGMYTTATFQLSKALGLPFLDAIARYFVYIALASWVLVFLGMARRLWPRFAVPAPITEDQPPS